MQRTPLRNPARSRRLLPTGNFIRAEPPLLDMAKHGKGRRKMGRYIRGSIDVKVDLGTLAAGIAVSGATGSVNERTLCSSIVCTYSLSEFTPAAGDGPITVGVAHGEYNVTEIKEYLENAGSWTEGDKLAQEIGGRQIRRIGTFRTPDGVTAAAVLNDGKPIKTKLNWILNQAQTLDFWAFNDGESALETTDPDFNIQGHANLWPGK